MLWFFRQFLKSPDFSSQLGRWNPVGDFFDPFGPPIERDQIVLEYYRRDGFEQLLTKADWDQLAGHEAYRALAINHFSEFADKLRDDMRTDFAAAYERYYQNRLAELRSFQTALAQGANPDLLDWPKKVSDLSTLRSTLRGGLQKI